MFGEKIVLIENEPLSISFLSQYYADGAVLFEQEDSAAQSIASGALDVDQSCYFQALHEEASERAR